VIAMTFGEIKRSGRPYYETILNGCMCRFYQHENGGWSCRMSTVLSVGSHWYPTKQETWREAKRISHVVATNPAIADAFRPRYTNADIERYNGIPDTLCCNGAPV
jgi:hypothetical protein